MSVIFEKIIFTFSTIIYNITPSPHYTYIRSKPLIGRSSCGNNRRFLVYDL